MIVTSESAQENTTTHETSQHSENLCPDCGSHLKSDEHRAETYCEECGTVVSSEELDHGPEWRSFEDTKGRKRTGRSRTKLLHNDGLGDTKISFNNRDGQGRQVSSKKRRQLHRLRRENRRAQTTRSKERTLRSGTTEIRRMGSALGVSKDVQETAAIIFRRASDEELFIGGFSIEEMASGSIYAGIKQIGLPITLGDVVAVSRVGDSRVKRGYSKLNRGLGLELEARQPEDYISKILSELNDPEKGDEYSTQSPERELRTNAIDILEGAHNEYLTSGRKPIGLAAAAIYAAERRLTSANEIRLEKTITQQGLADVADVSEVTLRTNYQDYLDHDLVE